MTSSEPLSVFPTLVVNTTICQIMQTINLGVLTDSPFSHICHLMNHQVLSICDKNVEKLPFWALSPDFVLIFSMWIATISS